MHFQYEHQPADFFGNSIPYTNSMTKQQVKLEFPCVLIRNYGCAEWPESCIYAIYRAIFRYNGINCRTVLCDSVSYFAGKLSFYSPSRNIESEAGGEPVNSITEGYHLVFSKFSIKLVIFLQGIHCQISYSDMAKNH